jgi:riboflavin kinase / FMN adenylyltransferase
MFLTKLFGARRLVNAQSVVVTFEPHPARILRPDQNLKLLTPLPEKLRLLEATGVDAVLLLPFSRDLSLMTPHQFAHEILKKRLHAREVHEGYNFHFGHKAEGNIHLLRNLGREMGFEVHDYPEMRLRGENVSSSHIRKLLSEGRVSRARHLLQRPFSILSTAGRGRGYGAKYTVPTINLSHYEELVPKHGVYITRCRIGDECFDSVTNIGNRPTFGSDSFAIESHLLNFHPIQLSADFTQYIDCPRDSPLPRALKFSHQARSGSPEIGSAQFADQHQPMIPTVCTGRSNSPSTSAAIRMLNTGSRQLATIARVGSRCCRPAK